LWVPVKYTIRYKTLKTTTIPVEDLLYTPKDQWSKPLLRIIPQSSKQPVVLGPVAKKKSPGCDVERWDLIF